MLVLGICAFTQLQAKNASLFSVGCVNCGAFHYGNGRATTEFFASEWKRLLRENQQDVFFFSDIGKGRFGNIALPKFDIRANAEIKPFSYGEVSLPRSIETPKGIKKTRRYRALRLVYELGRHKLAVYGVHLVAESHISSVRGSDGLSPSQHLRKQQFKALIEDSKQFDYAIFTGDFNAQKALEYDILVKAGYKLGNCSSEYGTFATLRDIPADNIIISPNMSFMEFKVLKEYLLDTDHLPIVAKVKFERKDER
jgi:hypothetical protein